MSSESRGKPRVAVWLVVCTSCHRQRFRRTTMGNRHWKLLLIGVLCIGLLSSTFASAQGFGAAYDRGYREGVQQGEQDSRQGRDPQWERSSIYRDADRGYNDRYGSRDSYRDEFRRGFASG